jgi:hypothetical protein
MTKEAKHKITPRSLRRKSGASLQMRAVGIMFSFILGALLCLAFSLPAAASYMPFNTSVNMNVGIGTSTPQSAFVVVNGNVGIGTWTAAGGNLIVNGGGNVGISTAWPGQALDVNGTVRMTGLTLTGNGAANGFVMVGNSVGVGTWMASTTLNVTAAGTPGGSVPQLQFNSAGTIGGVSASGADANGNIGIGTSGPLEKLAVAGNVGIGTVSYSPYITTAPTASGLVVEGNVGIGTWKNGAAGLSVMNGNVGIGTWTASSALEIEGGNVGIGTSANSAFPLYIFADAANSSTGLFINNPDTNNAVAQLTLVAGVQKWQINNQGDQSNQINFVYNGSSMAQLSTAGLFTTGGSGILPGGSGISSTSNLSVGSNFSALAAPANGAIIQGNVGVGTVQPGSALTVVGNIGIGTVKDGDAYVTNAAPNGGMAIEGNAGIGTYLPSQLLEIGKQKVDVTSGGNVGIGTILPTGKLEIEGGNVGINTAATTSNALTVFGGNVGIGTTIAPDSLYVAGTAEVQNFKMNNGAASGYVMVGNSVGVGTWMSSTTLNVTAGAGGSVPQLQFNSGGTLSGVSGSGVDANGNIGIGTSGPAEKLAIVGNVGIGTESYSSFVTTAPTASGLVVEGNVGIGTWKIGSAALNVMNGNVGIGTWTASSALEVEGGNVGIGTSANPPSQLYVYANLSSGTTSLTVNNGSQTNPVAQLSMLTATASGNVFRWDINNEGDSSNQLNFLINGSSAAQFSTTGLFTSGATGITAGGSGISSASNFSAGSNYYALAAPTNGAIIQGNVGVGTVQPGSVLTVVGNIGIGTVKDGDSYVTNAAPNGGLAIEGNVGIGTWLPNAALIVRSGNVGIGTANANYSLQIGGCSSITGTTSCVDLAELIPSSQMVSSGDVVMLDPTRSITVMKATRKDNDLLFGVVTTDPAIVIEGSTVGILNGKGYNLDPHKPAVALAGRVPVKVNLENGPIQVGDMITTSSSPGIGTKAVRPGRVIGMALEPAADLEGAPFRKIYAYINPHWWENTPFIDEEIARLKAENKEFESRLEELEKRSLGKDKQGS